MAHKTGVLRTVSHSGLECPLASLGRTGSTVMGALTGLHQSDYHHHPLSSSPLDPQVYQMSRKSPDLTTDADDIIYTAKDSISVMTSCQGSSSEVIATPFSSISSPASQLDPNSKPKSKPITGELYNLSRSSSQSSLEESLRPPPLPVERNATTFEFRSCNHNQCGFMSNGIYKCSKGKMIPKQHQTKLGIPSSDADAGMATSLMIQGCSGGFIAMTNTSFDTEGSSDANNSSRSKNCNLDISNSSLITSPSSAFRHRHYRPVCHGATNSVVPTKLNTERNLNSNDTALITSPPPPIYLEKEMNALYFGTGVMRTLPLSSESSSTFENDIKYLSNNSLRHISDYSKERHNCYQEPVQHMMHHRVSSPSETSGSERYILNRTNSPANVFSSCNIDNHESSGIIGNHSNNSNATIAAVTNSSIVSSNNIAYLDSRCYHSKLQSLCDGFCNLGRFSPNLDQGYATLVSPSPTGHHSSNISIGTVPTNMVHNISSLSSHLGICSTTAVSAAAATAAAVARRYTDNGDTSNHGGSSYRSFGPPPWNRKGPYQAGPFFNCLPDEAIIRIFNWLESHELCQVARVCRRFEQLAWLPALWKIITLRGERLCGDKVLKMIFRQLCGQTRNGSCPEVERVMLADNCKISDKGLQLLTRRCPELTHLQLHGCVNITNQALEDVLIKCNNIQHLDVTGCIQITSIAPAITNIEPNRRLLLQYLDLTDCLALNDTGLKIVVKNCPQLIYLYIRRCVQISDAGLKFVPSFCIALKELSVSDCNNITDFGLYELAKLGASLRYLSVAKCDRVSDVGLKVVARRCYKLRYLNARGCEAVSDDSVTVLARSCSRLRALDIGKCDVSDAGLRALAESCPNLKKLSLRNCDMITDRGVQCIAYYCRGLQQLNIQDCQISIEGYRAVKKYCKRCIIEHTNPGFC